MEQYSEKEVLRLARRIHNTKRSYLLVNPIQGKHVPVSPQKTFEMSHALGELLVREAPDAGIVIGFAETATAIAAIAAMSFPEDTVFLHTTREKIDSDHVVHFLEEHSHAVDQSIECSEIAQNKTNTIVMIDDEISTGRTIENIVTQLRQTFPFLEKVRFVIGSIMNRMEDSVREQMRQENIHFFSLVQVQNRDFEAMAQAFDVREPQMAGYVTNPLVLPVSWDIPNPRKGISVRDLVFHLEVFADSAVMEILRNAQNIHKLLVLGTEECMTAAIMTGLAVMKKRPDIEVYCHATTRSPIGICDEPEYPCRNGFQLESFYEKGRKTYLYNIRDYDRVVIVTDSLNTMQAYHALNQLTALYQGHCAKVWLLTGKNFYEKS